MVIVFATEEENYLLIFKLLRMKLQKYWWNKSTVSSRSHCEITLTPLCRHVHFQGEQKETILVGFSKLFNLFCLFCKTRGMWLLLYSLNKREDYSLKNSTWTENLKNTLSCYSLRLEHFICLLNTSISIDPQTCQTSL